MILEMLAARFMVMFWALIALLAARFHIQSPPQPHPFVIIIITRQSPDEDDALLRSPLNQSLVSPENSTAKVKVAERFADLLWFDATTMIAHFSV